MDQRTFIEINNFLLKEIGISSSAVNLGLKLAKENKTSFPITLWSYGILSTNDLNKLYGFIYKTNQ